MKKILILISMLLLVSGCNYNELNNYAIVTGMAIDKNNDKFEVSTLISSTKENKDNSSNIVYSGKGKTIYEAIKGIEKVSPKKLYIGHLGILLISDQIAKEGINNSLEFLLQEPQSRKNFFIALAQDNKAKEILSITSPLTDFSSQNLQSNIKTTSKLQGNISNVSFNSLLYKLVNNGTNPTLSSFKIVKQDKEKQVKISNMGIFKDDKLVSFTDDEEAKGINIINNSITELFADFKIDNKDFIVSINNLETKKVINKDKEVVISVRADSKIEETNYKIDYKDTRLINKIKNKTKKSIENYANKAILKAKKYNTDIFDLGLIYYQNYPSKFNKIKDWNDEFKNIKIKINVDINMNLNNHTNMSLERISNEKN